MSNCRECDLALTGKENFCPKCGVPDPSGPPRVSDLEVVLSDPLSSFLSPMAIREVASDRVAGIEEEEEEAEAQEAESHDVPSETPDSEPLPASLGTGAVPSQMEEGLAVAPAHGPATGDEAVDDSDMEPVTWVVMGLRAQDRGEVAEALACFENALELD